MATHDMILYKINTLSDKDLKQVSDYIDLILRKKNSAARQDKRSSANRLYGAAKGFFEINGDFNEPLKDFREYM